MTGQDGELQGAEGEVSLDGQPMLPPHDRTTSAEQLLELRRTGTVMSPDPHRPEEAEGVLNPASARSRDGDLYLFPRVVAKGNHSRIAMATVRFDSAGDPASVERAGLALEPQESYELARDGMGGVEDPRITYVPLLDFYVLSYTALSPDGPRIALAVSKDFHSWTRLGLLSFEPMDDVDFNRCDNKDCVLFPVPVRDPAGRPAFALLHRPIYQLASGGSREWLLPPGVSDRRPSIWISYAPLDRVMQNMEELIHVSKHRLLAHPLGTWENHHIGSGAPPLLTEEGWLLYYHGVLGTTVGQGARGSERSSGPPLTTLGTHRGPPGVWLAPGTMVYQTGVMLLDASDPRRVLFRSSRPVLVPRLFSERHGVVPNVVFPTAVDVRGRRIDVYYGAADQRIAAATTQIASPVLLAPSAPPIAEERHHFVVPCQLAGKEFETEGRHEQEGDIAMKAEDTDNYCRILVALDGSPFAERVLPRVEPLAQKFGSTVTLIQAITPVQAPQMAELSSGVVSVEAPRGTWSITDEMRAHADSYLASVRKRLEARGLSVETECPEGEPSSVILHRACQLRADLIAITTHGRSGVDRMLFGSVAEDVLRRAPCPVLLVRVQDGH